MFKSIFTKYLSVLTLIVLISFTAMGLVQMLLFTRYWVQEKQDWMERASTSVSVLTSERTVYNAREQQYEISTAALSPLLKPLASIDNAHVLVVDNAGSIVICSGGASCPHETKAIPESILKKIANPEDGKQFFSLGTLDGIYTSAQYVSACTITVGDDQAQIGYAFVSIPSDSLGDYVKDNIRLFLLSALGVLALTFVVVYILTYRLVRPLREMAAATRRFGEGDFSMRIPVTGKDEIAELATALNNMAISLSGVEDMRRSFVANVSHELKTDDHHRGLYRRHFGRHHPARTPVALPQDHFGRGETPVAAGAVDDGSVPHRCRSAADQPRVLRPDGSDLLHSAAV